MYAIQEERITRKKNFWGMPKRAIEDTLARTGNTWADIDVVAFGGKRHSGHRDFGRDELVALERRIIDLDLVDALRGRSDVPVATIVRRMAHAGLKRTLPRVMYDREVRNMRDERLALFREYFFPAAERVPLEFLDHHDCHFATAYFGNGRPDGPRLVFTLDGQGDGRCGSVSLVDAEGRRTLLDSIPDTDSLGQVWALVTLLMGFVAGEHEYKLMGMAPYAAPDRAARMAADFESLFVWESGRWRLRSRGSVHSFYIKDLVEDLRRILKFRRFDDVCGGLQLFTEKAHTQWITHWTEKTGVGDIHLSGGVFMNVKANLEIARLPNVRSMYIFPSPGDETNAIGACYLKHFTATGRFPEGLAHYYLGPSWSEKETEMATLGLDLHGVKVERPRDIAASVAQLLADGNAVARFAGREEFGARALGNRSILADPSRWEVVDLINDMIKKRDFWMPFACSILYEERARYLDNPKDIPAPYMITAFRGGPEIDRIVAGTHPRDKSVRPQIVTREQNPDYHRLISEFRDRTGIGAVLNTSFNLHGYPLVHTPKDAVGVFLASGLKHLALGPHLLTKERAA